MKKINKALMGMLTFMGSMMPLYGDDTVPSGVKTIKSSNKAPPGGKTSSDVISNQRFQGKNAQKTNNKTHGGDGLLIKPLLGHASLKSVISAGGAGNSGGHGVAAYGGVKKLNMDGSTITGGAVKKVKTLLPEDLKSPVFVGGAGIFCQAPPLQAVDITINNSTITGGAASGAGNLLDSVGNGLAVMGRSDILLNNAAVLSGNNGRGGDAVNAGGGSVTVVKSLVKSHGAAGIGVTGPTLIRVDNTSKIDGGKNGGIGIYTRHGSSVELSGTVKGGRYAVLFSGDNNTLTLRNGFNLQGKIAADGINNRLNLMSANQDENSFDLSIIGIANNRQGFSALDKMGEGNWTLNNNNVAAGGLEQVAVKHGSLTLAKTAILSAGEVYNGPAAFLGGSGTIRGNVKNAGTLYMGKMQPIAPFQSLIIEGDYHGEQDSLIRFNTRLEGDDSLTDRLVVRGKITGHSLVQINNFGGAGARTDKGILIIEAQPGNNPPPADTFSLSHRVVAGAYDYFLKQEGNRWLLSTDLPGQSVSPPVGTTTSASEQTQGNLPPPKPPRSFSHKAPEEDLEAQKSSPPPKPPRTFNQLDESATAETNQVLVTAFTRHDQGITAADTLAETKHPDVACLTMDEVPFTLMAPEAETDITAVKPMARDIDPPATADESDYHPLPIVSVMAGQAPLRPEPGIYAANLAAANTLFITGMHDRIGEPAYPGALASLDESVYPALWIRMVGGRNKASMANGQIATRTDSQLVQLGGEILHVGGNGSQGTHIGLMAGGGQSRSRSRAAVTGYQAAGGIEGYAVGLYGTWHQDDCGQKGPYLDVSLNYGWFNNRVKGESLAEERYRSKGLAGSVEAGYHRKFHEGSQVNAYLQPRLQLTWMGVRAAHTEINGDRFVLLGSGNIQSRLGNRVYIEKHVQGLNGRQHIFKPYIETSWVHNTRAFGVSINGDRLRQEGGRNLAEVKIGHEGQANRRVAVWGSLGYQAGTGGFSNTVGTLGIKARF
jgi:outer membrane autotransporter protein